MPTLHSASAVSGVSATVQEATAAGLVLCGSNAGGGGDGGGDGAADRWQQAVRHAEGAGTGATPPPFRRRLALFQHERAQLIYHVQSLGAHLKLQLKLKFVTVGLACGRADGAADGAKARHEGGAAGRVALCHQAQADDALSLRAPEVLGGPQVVGRAHGACPRAPHTVQDKEGSARTHVRLSLWGTGSHVLRRREWGEW
jgi:hypothetical protein